MKTAPAGFRKGKFGRQALQVLKERYLWKDTRGRVVETPEGMFYRVAREIAGVEAIYSGDKKKQEDLTRAFYEVMLDFDFLPNSPTLMNAGKGGSLQYAACYVLPVEDSISGILEAVKRAAIVHQSGGGTGFSFSRLRPGVSFMKVFEAATEQIKQGGKRRGANMGVLRVDHPDIEEFISCKESGGITNFNISVGLTNEFMKALKKEGKYYLRAGENWPKPGGGKYKLGEKIRQVEAKQIFEKIVKSAWKSGDPGLIWLDWINEGPANPVPFLGPIEATNPCGEQPLYPNEACNLGSINLARFVKRGKKKQVDWERLEKVVTLAVRFLDNVIDINPFPLPEIKEAVFANRRIGLGVMGWADLLFQLELAYDSREACALGGKIMGFIGKKAWKESERLAKEKGEFPNFSKSIYSKGEKRRNATVTTIAPTGSISIIANCSSGIEPIFALAFRHKTKEREMSFVNEYFKEAARVEKLSKEVIDKVLDEGSLSKVKIKRAKFREVFKTAHEISWKDHIKMQAAFQRQVDNAVSKTINLTSKATEKEVASAYLLAYKLGCAGVTVFRDGCKGEQVLNLGTEEKEKVSEKTLLLTVKARPQRVAGYTYRAETPVGTAFVTVNHNGEVDEPLEVFVNVGRAGSDVAADAEAMGRLISLCLRVTSPHFSQREVARLIVAQLEGIGGGGSVGFGKERVRSLADGIAKVIREHLESGALVLGKKKLKGKTVQMVAQQQSLEIPKKERRDICASCGNATLVLAEGCAKCLTCGYSKC